MLAEMRFGFYARGASGRCPSVIPFVSGVDAVEPSRVRGDVGCKAQLTRGPVCFYPSKPPVGPRLTVPVPAGDPWRSGIPPGRGRR